MLKMKLVYCTISQKESTFVVSFMALQNPIIIRQPNYNKFQTVFNGI